MDERENGGKQNKYPQNDIQRLRQMRAQAFGSPGDSRGASSTDTRQRQRSEDGAVQRRPQQLFAREEKGLFHGVTPLLMPRTTGPRCGMCDGSPRPQAPPIPTADSGIRKADRVCRARMARRAHRTKTAPQEKMHTLREHKAPEIPQTGRRAPRKNQERCRQTPALSRAPTQSAICSFFLCLCCLSQFAL